MARLRAAALLESAIYGPDLALLETFYVEVFGLVPIDRAPGRLVALRCGHSALLLFDAAVTQVAGGPIPPHGATGGGHIAFVVPASELPAWRRHLADHGITVEREIAWPEGGTSLYIRDPAGNSVELAPPFIWRGLGRELLESVGLKGGAVQGA